MKTNQVETQVTPSGLQVENGGGAWKSLRDSEDSRYVGLCMPRFLLRLPYGSNTVPVKAFNFEEDVVGHHERYCWGNAAVALAVLTANFVFMEPHFALGIRDTHTLATVSIMLGAGLAISALTIVLRAKERTARDRASRTAAMLSFTASAPLSCSRAQR